MNKILINLKDVSLNYGEHQILSDINLSVKNNTITTIVGPNGGGKTSLLKILLGIKKPTKGTVNKLPDLTCGYVPQSYDINNVMPMTVGKLLNFKYTGSRRFYNKVLSYLNIDHLLTRQLVNLSGGQMQICMLARALLRKPDVIILDEPDQYIDLNGQNALYKLINELKEEFKLTIILVSHNLNLVMRNCDYVICINKHICCHGTPESVMLQVAEANPKDHDLSNLITYYHNHNHRHQLFS